MNEIERKKFENSYKGLAAELRQRMGNKDEKPILLPPQDYDTLHRSKGNLVGIEVRKCLREGIVGSEQIFEEEENEKGQEGGASFNDIRNPDDIIPVQPRWKKPEAHIHPRDVIREPQRSTSPEPQNYTEEEWKSRRDEGGSARASGELVSVRTSTETVDSVFDEDAIRHIAPRWKKGIFVPPQGPIVERRQKQPNAHRANNPVSRESRHTSPPRERYNRIHSDANDGEKKYTASKLGLHEGNTNRREDRLRRNASADEADDVYRRKSDRKPVTRHHSQTKSDSNDIEYDDWKEKGNRRSQDYQQYH